MGEISFPVAKMYEIAAQVRSVGSNNAERADASFERARSAAGQLPASLRGPLESLIDGAQQSARHIFESQRNLGVTMNAAADAGTRIEQTNERE